MMSCVPHTKAMQPMRMVQRIDNFIDMDSGRNVVFRQRVHFQGNLYK